MVCMIAQSFMDCNHFFTEISQNCDDIYYANTYIRIKQRVLLSMIREECSMQIITNTDDLLFCDYYKQWIDTYKEGAIRSVTMKKYIMTHIWLEKLVPTLKVSEFTRTIYQQLLNSYAEFHEHQTTMDFHHHVKCAILDAVDEGLISRNPTRKAIIKGKQPSEKKTKYLNQFELQKLLAHLELGLEIN